MLPLAKILLPIDFSERSPGAARYAKMLACRFHSELTVVHVVPINSMMYGAEVPYGGFLEIWEKLRGDAYDRIASFSAKELNGVPLKNLVLEGDPAREIVRVAHHGKFDLIVLPTHGYGPFRRFILGSVTTKVLSDADCPVLTGVHISEVEPAKPVFFRNILCAIDLGPQSEKTLRWAFSFAQEFQASLSIVHALPPLEVGQARYFDAGWRTMVEQQAVEQLKELATKVGTSAPLIIENGDLQEIVREAAQSVQADMAVIGRHAGSGLIGRLRAHAYAIIRESPCPVVSV
jgi:nucleotide-binding universal stress UspA family protein